MSTRQKRGGQKNSDPVTKAARVERPIQGPEVHEAQVNSSPNSVPDLDPASESDSEDEDDKENPGLVDDEDDEEEYDPLRHLTVLQRNNLAAGKQD